jgi:hypothetical protein
VLLPSKRASTMQSIFCASEGDYLRSVPGSAPGALAAMLLLCGCETQGSASTFASAPPSAVASQTVTSPDPLPVTWQVRLSGEPHIFAVDYVQMDQLINGQGNEPVFARYPLVITGETYATANRMTTHLDKLRSLNANIVLIGYLNPLQDSLPEATGPGYDAMRYLESIESAYLHDVNGNRLYVPGATEVCNATCTAVAYFDPSSSDVHNAVLAAIQAMRTAYPFDGIFLDNYDVQNAMVLDTQGHQYLGAPGQVMDLADYASKLAAVTALATMIRDASPNILIEANGDNDFPPFNGELVEGHGQISRLPAQAAAIAGRVLPFMPLFMDDPVPSPVDPLIATDMTQVQALGAWYGASVTYTQAIWPAAFGP